MVEDAGWGAFREEAKARKEALGPERMIFAKRALSAKGCRVEEGTDGQSYFVWSPDGKQRFHFWPYNGWFNGKRQGRGLANLMRAMGLDPDRS